MIIILFYIFYGTEENKKLFCNIWNSTDHYFYDNDDIWEDPNFMELYQCYSWQNTMCKKCHHNHMKQKEYDTGCYFCKQTVHETFECEKYKMSCFDCEWSKECHEKSKCDENCRICKEKHKDLSCKRDCKYCKEEEDCDSSDDLNELIMEHSMTKDHLDEKSKQDATTNCSHIKYLENVIENWKYNH